MQLNEKAVSRFPILVSFNMQDGHRDRRKAKRDEFLPDVLRKGMGWNTRKYSLNFSLFWERKGMKR